MAKFLITGGAGFIGGNFLHIMINKYPKDQYVCVDALTYAGNIETLNSILNKSNFKFIHENICNREAIFKIFEQEHFDYVINFAAESHVDKSIENPEIFLKTNVFGTQVLLDACKKYGIRRFHQISTDEVYGDADNYLDKNERFNENSSLHPSSPYSASKASADLLVLAYHRTFGIPVTISRSSNNYGPYQYPEKLIPLMIEKASSNALLPVYGNGSNIRNWLYVDDNCEAIDLIVRKGRDGEIYNICSSDEKSNLQIVKIILKELNKPESLITYVKDRPGHDLYYAVDSTKIERKLGWKPVHSFDKGILETIKWNIDNKQWLKIIKQRKDENAR